MGLENVFYEIDDAKYVKQAFVIHLSLLRFYTDQIVRVIASDNICDVNDNTEFIMLHAYLHVETKYTLWIVYRMWEERSAERIFYICFSKHFRKAKELQYTTYLYT